MSQGKQIRSGHTIRPLPDVPILRDQVLAVSRGQTLVIEEPGDAGPGSACNGEKTFFVTLCLGYGQALLWCLAQAL